MSAEKNVLFKAGLPEAKRLCARGRSWSPHLWEPVNKPPGTARSRGFRLLAPQGPREGKVLGENFVQRQLQNFHMKELWRQGERALDLEHQVCTKTSVLA